MHSKHTLKHKHWILFLCAHQSPRPQQEQCAIHMVKPASSNVHAGRTGRIFGKVLRWSSYRWVFETDAWDRRSSWTVRPKLGIYWVTSKTPLISHLSIREEQRMSVTDPSPDHSSRLADSAAQGLSEPEAMPLYSAALGGFSCHELLSWKRQFSILSNAIHVSHYLGKETPPFVCFELTAC